MLRDEETELLRVFVRASVEKRIRRKMRQEQLNHEKAARLVRRMDKQRKNITKPTPDKPGGILKTTTYTLIPGPLRWKWP